MSFFYYFLRWCKFLANMNNIFILIILLFYLNCYMCTKTTTKTTTVAGYTPKVTPKKHGIAFNYKIADEISKEIKHMNIPDLVIKDNKGNVNVSLSAMKVNRADALGDVSKVKFKLFTRASRVQPEYLSANGSNIKNSGFDCMKEVKLVVHGWMRSSLYESCVAIKDACLKYLDANVILVDWAEVAGSFYYPCVAAQSKAIGWCIGEFLNNLINFGCNPEKIHVIGHSLGPHIAAFASEITIGKLGRITALDPALPGFVLNTLSQFGGSGRLMADHALFVDVIHTNGGTFGMLEPCGHVDFYPNGGQIQPGCWIVNFLCSHYRSYDLYEESISKCLFPAKPCDGGSGEEILMGEPTPYTARGRYCLNTNNQSPYGIVKQSREVRSRKALPSNGRRHARKTNNIQTVKKGRSSSSIIKSLVLVCEAIIAVNLIF